MMVILFRVVAPQGSSPVRVISARTNTDTGTDSDSVSVSDSAPTGHEEAVDQVRRNCHDDKHDHGDRADGLYQLGSPRGRLPPEERTWGCDADVAAILSSGAWVVVEPGVGEVSEDEAGTICESIEATEVGLERDGRVRNDPSSATRWHQNSR